MATENLRFHAAVAGISGGPAEADRAQTARGARTRPAEYAVVEASSSPNLPRRSGIRPVALASPSRRRPFRPIRGPAAPGRPTPRPAEAKGRISAQAGGRGSATGSRTSSRCMGAHFRRPPEPFDYLPGRPAPERGLVPRLRGGGRPNALPPSRPGGRLLS